jgi:hypothetical protein
VTLSPTIAAKNKSEIKSWLLFPGKLKMAVIDPSTVTGRFTA